VELFEIALMYINVHQVHFGDMIKPQCCSSADFYFYYFTVLVFQDGDDGFAVVPQG